jgi:hypothetical protein
MDNEAAIAVLEREMDLFRQEPYADLVRRIDVDPIVLERLATGATTVTVEIQFLWDGPRGGDVRVIGSVDDGGLRAFVPITRSFIKSADGSFVGE